MTTFAPTSEQQAIINAVLTGQDGVIEAGAGTGKTSTLNYICEAVEPQGKTVTVIFYNKAAQVDAKARFPKNADPRTAHSLAYASQGKRFRDRMRFQKRVSSRNVAVSLGISAPVEGLTPGQLASLTGQTVNRFCQSADTTIGMRHVPAVDGIENMDLVRSIIVPFAEKMWKELQDPNGRDYFFTHDMYLKMWALTNPTIKGDIIMVDEAQDTNPVLMQVVHNQPVQKIMVGDRSQAIYGWRGAVDAMQRFDADWRLNLTQSFRFGPAVADEANKYLNMLDAPLRLKGFDKIESEVTTLDDNNVDAILCRTNGAVMANAIEAQAQGKKVAIVGGTKDIEKFAWGVHNLQKGQKVEHPDLMGFDNWDEVVDYAENDAAGADLKVWVKLIQTYGVYKIIDVAKASTDEQSADIIVSTAHKSKGREWDRVRIGEDFKAPEDGGKPSKADLMLLYVAVTRAKLKLDCTALGWVESVMADAA